MPRECSFEVAVVGAGPAGSLLAARLAGAGVRVVVIEASAFDRQRVGEFLTPRTRTLLNGTAVLPVGWESRHRTIHEFVGNWGAESNFERSFIFDAHGHGLALDRAAFDRELANAAAERGATVLTRTRVCAADRTRDGWTLAVRKGLDFSELRANFLMVCCGRKGPLLPGIPPRRTRLDRLVCLGMRIGGCPEELQPSIESYSRGWTYTAVSGCNELVVNLCTELKGEWAGQVRSPELFLREIANCPIASSRVLACDPAKSDVSFFAVDASSGVSRPAAGDGWCLAGDCAQSSDPLSSNGIGNAIQHAERIFDSMRHSGDTGRCDLREYSARLDDEYRAYSKAHGYYYGLETRWKSAFWTRRQPMVFNAIAD